MAQKLPLVSSRDLIKYLATRGFRHVHTKGSHHVLQCGMLKVVVPERRQVGRGLLLSILADADISRCTFLSEYGHR